MKRLSIYLAGPMTGLDIDELYRLFHDRARRLRELGFNVLHPLMGKEHLLGQGEVLCGIKDDNIASDRAILGRDRWMVRKADIVLADLTAAHDDPTLGTACEITWAWDQRNTLVITVGLGKGHSMDHPFIRQASNHIFDTYEEAEEYLPCLIG